MLHHIVYQLGHAKRTDMKMRINFVLANVNVGGAIIPLQAVSS